MQWIHEEHGDHVFSCLLEVALWNHTPSSMLVQVKQ